MKSFIVSLLVVSALAVSYGAPNFFQTIHARARSALREYPAEKKTVTKRGECLCKKNSLPLSINLSSLYTLPSGHSVPVNNVFSTPKHGVA